MIAPLFKKLDPLEVKNCRPVSILPILSKVFEKIFSKQLSEYFKNFSLFYVSSEKDMGVKLLC